MNTTETAAPTQAHYEGPGVVSQTLLGAGAMSLGATMLNSFTKSGAALRESAVLQAHLAAAQHENRSQAATEYETLLKAGEKEFSAAASRASWIAGAGALIGGALSYFSARGARQQFEQQNATITALHGQVQEISAQRDTMAAHIVATQEHKAHHTAPATAIHASTAEHHASEHAQHHHTAATHEGHASTHQPHEGHVAAAKHRAEAAPEHHARG